MTQIGFGTWPLGGQAYGPVEVSTATEALKAALDCGIGLFDTADIYGDGRVETLIGNVIPKASEALITSKAGYVTERGNDQDFSARHLRQAVEGSLRRLRRDELDILLLHSPPEEILRAGEAFLTLDRMREEGIAKKTGVSLRTIDSWNAALQWPHCDVIEVVLNLLDQRPIDACLLEAARARNVRIIARVPLCFGFLSGRHVLGASFPQSDQRSRWPRVQLDAWIEAVQCFRFLEHENRSMTQSALAFCCSLPSVDWVIPGMKSVDQVLHNVRAGEMANRLRTVDLEIIRGIWQKLRHLPPGAKSTK